MLDFQTKVPYNKDVIEIKGETMIDFEEELYLALQDYFRGNVILTQDGILVELGGKTFRISYREV